MNHFLTALIIGIAAGVIDVVPMIAQKLDKRACLSAFMQWLFLGFIIPFVQWDVQPWIKGLIIGELAAIPVMIIVSANDKKALIPMSIFSAVLGIGVAIAGSIFMA
jgi:hypothetical protein